MKWKRNSTKVLVILLVLATIVQAVQIGQLQHQVRVQNEINKELVMGL